MPVTITPIYAALVALLFLGLSFYVISYRRNKRIVMGDVGDKAMLQRMRTHANCAEYAPICLILLLLVELAGAPAFAVHILGMMILAGRVLHAYGFSARPQIFLLRQIGMILTFSMIALSALGLLAHSLF